MKLAGPILATLVATGQGTTDFEDYLEELRFGCTNVISSSRFDGTHKRLTRDKFIAKWTNKELVIKTRDSSNDRCESMRDFFHWSWHRGTVQMGPPN